MNSIVQLASGSLRSEPVVDSGISIARLWRDAIPGLRATRARTGADTPYSGCYPLVRVPVGLTPSPQRPVQRTHPQLDVSIGLVSQVNNALTMAQGDTRWFAAQGVYLLQPSESFGANIRIESGPTP